jgi:hypothetical protein
MCVKCQKKGYWSQLISENKEFEKEITKKIEKGLVYSNNLILEV